MKFPLNKFYEFCGRLLIDSKDKGQIRLTKQNMLSTQRHFIEQIAKGLEEGIHVFVILKGRQEGITTISCALDLFWHFMYPGMQGTFAAHNEEARDNFRSMLTMYHSGLPKQFRRPIVQNNRYFMSFNNRSVIKMQIGGGKAKSGKGRGGAITFLHATEVSSWEDEESFASMRASCAQHNPDRLQIYESTARGYNLFRDVWLNAKKAVSQRAIFIGWWLNEFYRKEKDSAAYRVYWDGKMTPQEREWVRQVKQYYDYDIQPEQIAWWRWMMAEEVTDENLMMQEYPPTEYHAFIMSGQNFFSMQTIEDIETRIEEEDEPDYFKINFGDEFVDTTSEETTEAMADLTVWEHPDDAGYYSIGADPAYGSSSWADRFVIQVFRCYADRFEQVAEYCVTDLSTYRYAWVLVYLAGAYKNSMINLEINGPGQQVLTEMDALRTRASRLGSSATGSNAGLRDVAGGLRYYLYRRLDSPGGAGFVFHWKTTTDTKERMLNGYRDLIYRNQAIIHSQELIEEMKITVREDGFLGATGSGKDDRVIAASLSAVQYLNFIRGKLEQMEITWAKELVRREQLKNGKQSGQTHALQRNLENYLSQVGIKR